MEVVLQAGVTDFTAQAGGMSIGITGAKFGASPATDAVPGRIGSASGRRNHLHRGEAGPVASRIAGDERQLRHGGMSSDEEIRQGRTP